MILLKNPSLSVTQCCRVLNHSRQAYYQAQRVDSQRAVVVSLIVDVCREVRRTHPGMGTKKLKLLLDERLQAMALDISIGRDALYDVLRDCGLLIRQKKSKRRTTDSRHHLRRFSDLYNNFVPCRINQAWVADITYWQISTGAFLYIHLVTDAYSRMILGWCLSTTLHASHTTAAFVMALETLGQPIRERLLHHSDRGSQYCSDDYVAEAKKYDITMSMTQSGDPLDNAIAERVNGILKLEYLEHHNIETFEQAENLLFHSIHSYCHERPHMSLNNQTPYALHTGTATLPIKRLWKAKTHQVRSGPPSASPDVEPELTATPTSTESHQLSTEIRNK